MFRFVEDNKEKEEKKKEEPKKKIVALFKGKAKNLKIEKGGKHEKGGTRV